jgi:predicted DNA binding CopG/RHH family protein
MQHLNIEEQELLESIENDEWVSIANKQEELSRFQNMAKQQILKQKIELYMSTQDADKIYSLANQLGISVSNFVQDIVHRYLQGELVEKK